MRLKLNTLGAASALGAAMLLSLAGCGGGGGSNGLSGGGGGNNPPPTATPETGTAKFSVNVETGKVTVTPLNGSPANRAVFSGTAMSFESSDLLQDTGELTRRKLSVKLTNNTNETIGSPSNGFKVMFGEFKAPTGTDLRALTEVSTVIGSGASGSTDGPALAASLSSPHSVLLGNNGDIFFSGYNQSLRVSRNGYVSTLITGIGPVTSMVWRGGVPGDVIYAASLNTHRVYKLDLSTNTATLLAGTGSSGAVDGPGSTARFNLPYAVAEIPGTDATNPDLLVSEGTTGKLRRMTWDGTEYQVSTLGFVNDAPRGMVRLGDTGRFIVCEAFVRKITIFDLAGNKVSLGDGSSGQTDGDGNTMSFYEPIGVIYDDEEKTIYVSESGGTFRQLSLDPSGNYLFKEDWKSATIAGIYQAFSFADGRGDEARFLGPVCMAIDSTGDLYTADSGNSRIRKITPTNGRFPLDVGGTNTGVDKARLANPTDFVPTDAGAMPYILESQAIPAKGEAELTSWDLIVPAGVKSFEFIVTVEAQTDSAAPPDAVNNPGPGTAPGSSRAQVRTLAGRTAEGYVNGNVSGAAFDTPTAFAYDQQGNLFVADSENRAVRRITPSGQVSTIAGVPGNQGATDGNGTVATFGFVTGVAASPSGEEVFVADSTNNKIRRIALMGGDPTQPANWKVSTVAGAIGVAAYANGIGTNARFNKPYGIALASGGDLIVSEALGNRIRRITPVGENRELPASWTVSLVAGSESSAGPADGATDGFKSAAGFSEPRGLAISASGDIYVADFGNHRLRLVDPTGNVTTFAGSTAGYGDADVSTDAKFSSPTDVAVDRAGYVYVSDMGNFLLRRVSPSGSVRTVAGFGQTGTADGAGNVAKFTAMNGVEVSPSGDVILGDGNRIRLIQRLISNAAN